MKGCEKMKEFCKPEVNVMVYTTVDVLTVSTVPPAPAGDSDLPLDYLD